MTERTRTHERQEGMPKSDRDRAAREFVHHHKLIVALAKAQDREAYEATLGEIRSHRSNGDPYFRSSVTGIYVPMTTRFDRATQIALAHLGIRVFALRNDRLPNSLSEVTEAGILSRTPHAEGRPHEPLGYRKDPDDPASYVLYAFGPDCEDNNGLPDPEGGQPRPGYDEIYANRFDNLILDRLPPE